MSHNGSVVVHPPLPPPDGRSAAEGVSVGEIRLDIPHGWTYRQVADKIVQLLKLRDKMLGIKQQEDHDDA